MAPRPLEQYNFLQVIYWRVCLRYNEELRLNDLTIRDVLRDDHQPKEVTRITRMDGESHFLIFSKRSNGAQIYKSIKFIQWRSYTSSKSFPGKIFSYTLFQFNIICHA